MVKTHPTTPAKPRGNVSANTRKQAAFAVVAHVLENVLDKYPTDDPEYYNWFDAQKIKTMDDIMSCHPERMATQTYNNNGNVELPTSGMIGNFMILQAYHRFFCTNNNIGHMKNDDWMALTCEIYCGFKTTEYQCHSLRIDRNESSMDIMQTSIPS